MDKTEEPTPRRLRRALERGDSPISGLAVRAASTAVIVALAPALVGAVRAGFRASLATALATPESATPSAVVTDVLTLTAPMLGVAAVVATGVGLVQTGGKTALGNLAPKLERLAPGQGSAFLFDGERARRAITSAVLVVAASFATVKLLENRAPSLAKWVDGRGSLETAGSLLGACAWTSVALLAVIAAADVVLSRAAWLSRNRMTRRELRDEQREASGAPEARRARRRAHEESIG
jgi:flagellar biosynthesis protein FlhB